MTRFVLTALGLLMIPAPAFAQSQPVTPTPENDPRRIDECLADRVFLIRDLDGISGADGAEWELYHEGRLVDSGAKGLNRRNNFRLRVDLRAHGPVLDGGAYEFRVRATAGGDPVAEWSEPAVYDDAAAVASFDAGTNGVMLFSWDPGPVLAECARGGVIEVERDGAIVETYQVDATAGSESRPIEEYAPGTYLARFRTHSGSPGPDRVLGLPADPVEFTIPGNEAIVRQPDSRPPPPTLETFPNSCGRGVVRWDLSGMSDIRKAYIQIVRQSDGLLSEKAYTLPVQGEMPFDPFQQGHGALKGSEYRITVQGIYTDGSETPASEPAVFVEPVATAAIPDVQRDPDDPLMVIIRWDISRMPEIGDCGEKAVLEGAEDPSFDQVEEITLSESSGSLSMALSDEYNRLYLRLRIYNRTVDPENAVGLPSESVLVEAATVRVPIEPFAPSTPEAVPVSVFVGGVCDRTGISGARVQAVEQSGSRVVAKTTGSGGGTTLALAPGEWRMVVESPCYSEPRAVVVREDGSVPDLDGDAVVFALDCQTPDLAVTWDRPPQVEPDGRVAMLVRLSNLGPGAAQTRYMHTVQVERRESDSGPFEEVTRVDPGRTICPDDSESFTIYDANTTPERHVTYRASYMGEDIDGSNGTAIATLPPSVIRIVTFRLGQTRRSNRLPGAYASLDFTVEGRTPTRYRAAPCAIFGRASWADLPSSGVPVVRFTEPGVNQICLQLSDLGIESEVARNSIRILAPERVTRPTPTEPSLTPIISGGQVLRSDRRYTTIRISGSNLAKASRVEVQSENVRFRPVGTSALDLVVPTRLLPRSSRRGRVITVEVQTSVGTATRRLRI